MLIPGATSNTDCLLWDHKSQTQSLKGCLIFRACHWYSEGSVEIMSYLDFFFCSQYQISINLHRGDQLEKWQWSPLHLPFSSGRENLQYLQAQSSLVVWMSPARRCCLSHKSVKCWYPTSTLFSTKHPVYFPTDWATSNNLRKKKDTHQVASGCEGDSSNQHLHQTSWLCHEVMRRMENHMISAYWFYYLS